MRYPPSLFGVRNMGDMNSPSSWLHSIMAPLSWSFLTSSPTFFISFLFTGYWTFFLGLLPIEIGRPEIVSRSSPCTQSLSWPASKCSTLYLKWHFRSSISPTCCAFKFSWLFLFWAVSSCLLVLTSGCIASNLGSFAAHMFFGSCWKHNSLLILENQTFFSICCSLAVVLRLRRACFLCFNSLIQTKIPNPHRFWSQLFIFFIQRRYDQVPSNLVYLLGQFSWHTSFNTIALQFVFIDIKELTTNNKEIASCDQQLKERGPSSSTGWRE